MRRFGLAGWRALAVVGLALGVAHAQEADLLVADFEAGSYGAWTAAGTAFGSGPAQGTLQGQMQVDGFQGHGLVNSYLGGDKATGTLTSPRFKLQRRYLQFLIGGGGWEGRTCMNLLLDGQVLCSAAGTNTHSGGSEHLAPQQWDLNEFRGREVALQIVDDATGGWGHINVDQIVQTDRPLEGAKTIAPVKVTLRAHKRYLNLPVKNGAPMKHLKLLVKGQVQREFDIELASDKPDWWAFVDLTPFKGQEIELRTQQVAGEANGLALAVQANEVQSNLPLYQEPLRPQFHFSSQRGWLNDPNGLVFYRGEYHLFYQHNPYGWNWGNMTWGHAVSSDLVHWRELPNALYPDEHGVMYSGSVVVDWHNTTGFQTGKEPPLVAMFTAAGKPFTQGLAFSNDRGRTWTKYARNPVLGHIVDENRDPKVIWYAPEKKWVMALYLTGNKYALFASPDLKQWTRLCDVAIPGDAECPEFFEMPVDGDRNNPRWVFYGASGMYLVGSFDGTRFSPEGAPQALQHGNCWYASQTYNEIPAKDGRRILIPWGRSDIPGMPFNHMMGLPVELTLRQTDDGLRLLANPVKELTSLRQQAHRFQAQGLRPGDNPLAGLHGELFDLVAEVAPGKAAKVEFNVRGVPVSYDVKQQELACGNKKAALKMTAGTIRLRMLVDRTSIDIFGNDGRLYMPMAVSMLSTNHSLGLTCEGGEMRLEKLEVFELTSAWKK